MQALTLSTDWKQSLFKMKENCFSIFGVQIHSNSFNEATDWVLSKSAPHLTKDVFNDRNEQNQKTTCHFVNADCLNHAYFDKDYLQLLNTVERVFADGSGVRLACKIKNLPLPDNVNGTDLFPSICEKASKQYLKSLEVEKADARPLRIFLLGGKPGVANEMKQNMQKTFPNIDFVGSHHGYFQEEENSTVINLINASDANLLLVAMGAPKQEFWIEKFRPEINCNVCMGVGGLFDYYSNRIPRAPKWMRRIGCEWIWRFLQEPNRLAKRYFLGNFLFVFRVVREKLGTNKQKEILLNPVFKEPRYQSRLKRSIIRSILPKRQTYHQLQSALKRSFDIIGASLALLAFSPIMLLSMLLIYFESPGNVFFSQQRIGKKGVPFKLWKLRSMYSNADQRLKELQESNEMDGGVLFKIKNDPRITKVGKILRKYSIDELPQLWNVLIGEMSLVGPRPALAKEVEQYQSKDRQRLNIKPGLTCIWQVSGRSDIPFEKQVELDHQYLCQRSIWTDIKLLFATIPAVLMARGAY